MKSEDFLKNLGERVRELRRARGMSQEKLAELSDLHLTYVSKVERGLVNGSISAYAAIADALGMPLAEFIEPAWGRDKTQLTELVEEVRALPDVKQKAFLEIARGGLAGIRIL